ncbi:MAG: KH domain-containing protein [Candidatus Saccharimonadales bacterium]
MSNSIDQQFVEYVVKSLVSKPDAVSIERRIDEKGVLLELTVDPEDLGRVIGKRGATAQSLRTLLRALGTKNDARYNLKIIDNGFPPEKREAMASERSEDRPKAEAEASEVSEAKEEPVEELETSLPSNDESEAEPESADRYSKTRRELEEMDDLDL